MLSIFLNQLFVFFEQLENVNINKVNFVVFVDGWSKLAGDFELLAPRDVFVAEEEVEETVTFEVSSLLLSI